jgi:hypothetical protein
MRVAQTGTHRPSTAESNKRKSIALKRYYRQKKKRNSGKVKQVGGKSNG